MLCQVAFSVTKDIYVVQNLTTTIIGKLTTFHNYKNSSTMLINECKDLLFNNLLLLGYYVKQLFAVHFSVTDPDLLLKLKEFTIIKNCYYIFESNIKKPENRFNILQYFVIDFTIKDVMIMTKDMLDRVNSNKPSCNYVEYMSVFSHKVSHLTVLTERLWLFTCQPDIGNTIGNNIYYLPRCYIPFNSS